MGGIIVSLGYVLNLIPFVQKHETLVMNILMTLPVLLLSAGFNWLDCDVYSPS